MAIGVAGAGKSTLIAPVVAAAQDEDRQVRGIARRWKQATALREAGIDQRDIGAISSFLKRAESGRIKLKREHDRHPGGNQSDGINSGLIATHRSGSPMATH